MRVPNVWVMTKPAGSKTYAYWMASWREGGATRNVHIGSCARLTEAEAREKACSIKAASMIANPELAKVKAAREMGIAGIISEKGVKRFNWTFLVDYICGRCKCQFATLQVDAIHCPRCCSTNVKAMSSEQFDDDKVLSLPLEEMGIRTRIKWRIVTQWDVKSKGLVCEHYQLRGFRGEEGQKYCQRCDVKRVGCGVRESD